MDAGHITQIQKAREYAEQPELITFNSLQVEFRGDNSAYLITLGPDGWNCTCPGFANYAICPHIMAMEKLFKPMLKREPLPYALGQNIVSDVKKATRYAEETDRLRILAFDVTFKGRNNDHHVTFDRGKWTSTASHFQTAGYCSHTMAMERILKGMLFTDEKAATSPEA
jgi:hypothetical protein